MIKILFSIVSIFITILGFTQNVKDFNFKDYKSDKTINTKLPDPSDPSQLNAKAIDNSRINISWKQNSDNNDVLIVYSKDENFGTPIYGQVYNKFDKINGGGEVLYIGSAESCAHELLDEATLYYYKAFSIKNSIPDYSGGIVTSEVTHGPPFVSETIISSMTLSSVYAQAQIIRENGANITEEGFVFDLSQNPTINNNKVTSLNNTSPFNAIITSLNLHTRYYIRAYAINSYGTGYGKEISFVMSTITDINTINMQEYKIYPNPSLGTINLIIPSDFNSAFIFLTNMNGNTVFHKKIKKNISKIKFPLKLKGFYILHLESSNFLIKKKIIIQ